MTSIPNVISLEIVDRYERRDEEEEDKRRIHFQDGLIEAWKFNKQRVRIP